MILIYSPAEGDVQRWNYDPNRLMSAEREALEKRTGRDFSGFTEGVIEGSSVCRRALLHMFLKRAHPGVRYEDVDFCWDQLELQFSKQEYQAMRDAISQSDGGPDQSERLAAIDREMETAIDEGDVEGKARLPIAV